MTTLGSYNARGIGVPWVREEDYEAFLLVMEDAEHLPSTWNKFKMFTEMFEQKCKADGYIIERATIDPETFPDWCKANGERVNSQGRKHFAASVAAEKYGRNQS